VVSTSSFAESTVGADQEVKIPIDDSFTGPVCDYSVGFLRFRREDNREVAIPAGTGSFTKLGKVYGILTAGHAIAPMGKEEIVGLVRFPSIKPALQNWRLNLGHTHRIVGWNGKEGDAPDIAFLRIPEIDGRNLEAKGAVFYNLGISREFQPEKPNHRMSKTYAVVGVVGEWTEEGPAQHGKGNKVEVRGLFGAIKNLRSFTENGTDLVEAEIDHCAGPRIPKSYGGVSGGALWELHVELDEAVNPVKVNKRLHGVAFRESRDRQRITSNGSPAIEAIIKEMEEKWPESKS
jgi:hypothetical protein